jgi:cyclopropane fatty-acyl-phospholipid synthase-like methyltransferase
MNKPKPAYQIFDKAADAYQEKYMDVNLYANSFINFCNAIKPTNPHILELACGPGNVTRFLLQKRPDFQILATDLAPKMVALAKVNNPQVEGEILDVKDIISLKRRFEAIMCAFCLPYLSKEETSTLFNDAHKILNTSGIMYISTMEDDYSNSKVMGSETYGFLKMYFYQKEQLIEMLIESGFQILKTQRFTTHPTPNETVTDLTIIAKKV